MRSLLEHFQLEHSHLWNGVARRIRMLPQEGGEGRTLQSNLWREEDPAVLFGQGVETSCDLGAGFRVGSVIDRVS